MNHRQQPALHPSMQPGHRHIRSILARVFIGFSLLAAITTQASAEATKRLDVLELFTSQGCSSCPPADALLGTLSKGKDVLALTMPVNYWDHLGWRDTLAKEVFTKRQYAYAQARGDRQIYTPQLIINGATHVVGSQQPEIESALKSTANTLAPSAVPVTLSERDRALHIEIGAAPRDSKHRSGKIWVAFYSSSVSVEISRGENSGRHATYTNVVRSLVPVGQWSGETARHIIDIPKEISFDGIAVLLQADNYGAILGAAAISHASQ